MLLNSGSTIANISSKSFTTKARDSLQKSVGTLEIYRGLASEAYITLASPDPVDRAFVMSNTMKKLSDVSLLVLVYAGGCGVSGGVKLHWRVLILWSGRLSHE